MKNLSDYVKVYSDVFDKDFCESMINRFETLDASTAPSMRLSDHSWDKDYRRFLEVNVKQEPAFDDLIDPYYARIKEVYAHYKQMVGAEFFPSKFSLEEARMKRYLNDDYEQFGWHVDIGDKASASRYLVMFTYLNDVEEGGETEFQSNSNFTVKPKCGTMVVFPPYFMFEHRGKKPISNSKYILSTYLHYA